VRGEHEVWQVSQAWPLTNDIALTIDVNIDQTNFTEELPVVVGPSSLFERWRGNLTGCDLLVDGFWFRCLDVVNCAANRGSSN
jgi:hypothetical protein